MNNDEVKMGKVGLTWQGSDKGTKSITLCVTEDCNLACKYCYMTGKNHKNKMTFETAKKTIDYILSDKENFKEGAVIWDFIGGEPFLEIDLIDEICDYIKLQMYRLNHPWFNAYKFNFSSNGILYHTDKVQKYIEKNKSHVVIGISVDGNELKHDLQRIYPDGRGSYKDVLKNIPLWQKQFEGKETKATFSHDDIPYLKDSIISLWNIGIKEVSANVVFEDVWVDGDDQILEKQLDELGDYVIENKLWNECSVRFFDPTIGFPISEEAKDNNFCGAGKMLAVDCNGNFYSCIRFLDFSLNNKKGRTIGNVDTGIDQDKIRPFLGLTLKNQSKSECIECDVASGCAWCTGFNYDVSDVDTIYERATFICKMHKATVRANKRFWKKYEKVTGKDSPRRNYENPYRKKYLQFLLDNNTTPHCAYDNKNSSEKKMSKEVILKGLKFAENNDFEPIFLGDMNNVLSDVQTSSFINMVDSSSNNKQPNCISIYNNDIKNVEEGENCIILIGKDNISSISRLVNDVQGANYRINLILQDIAKWEESDIKLYEVELNKISKIIEKSYEDGNPKEINVLTDRLTLNKICDCGAGVDTFTLAPNGNIYICPAFYFKNEEEHIGNVEKGIQNLDKYHLRIEDAPICSNCDSYHCKRCIYLNKELTLEYNTSPKIQCIISHIEREATRKLQENLMRKKLISKANIIEELDYKDPLVKKSI